MTDDVIILEQVSKKFSLPSSKKTLIDKVVNKNFFWALQNICFRIENGESIAIIGKNGASKTLLLKVIAGIVYPTYGKVIIKKPVSTIFCYWTGFYPEYTGKENIYLYGSLLGLQKEILRKNFDNIIAFSELEDFIDLKVKHYSAGMIARLAFSVVSFLKPKILIMDEALSPGDASFVNKAHQKLFDLQKESTTMLMASHSMQSLKNLCKRGIVIDKGKILFDGDINSSIKYYSENVLSVSPSVAVH